MWKTVKRPEVLSAEWNIGDIRLAINPLDDHRQSQHFGLNFCQFTEADANSCLGTWPREAIALARKKLDEFESRLDAAGVTFPVEGLPEGVCSSCGERCVAQWMDFGIGPYEFWGDKGVHHEWAWASPCCEAPVKESFEDEDDE